MHNWRKTKSLPMQTLAKMQKQIGKKKMSCTVFANCDIYDVGLHYNFFAQRFIRPGIIVVKRCFFDGAGHECHI